VRGSIPIAAILVPAAFFLSVLSHCRNVGVVPKKVCSSGLLLRLVLRRMQ
jgi:hypothetical protein